MTGSVKNAQRFSVQLQHIAVPKLSVNITPVQMCIHFVHHNRYAEIVPDSGGTSHVVVMMMSEDYPQKIKPFLFHKIYKLFRFISRIYDIAAAVFLCTDYITVAFQTAAYKSFYLHPFPPQKKINKISFILYNKSTTLANFI